MFKRIIFLLFVLFLAPCVFAQEESVSQPDEAPVQAQENIQAQSNEIAAAEENKNVEPQAQENMQQQTDPEEDAKIIRLRKKYKRRALAREYAIQVQEKILENWKPVKYLMYSHQYKNNVTAEIKVNKSGSLETYRIVHSMQDKKAENSALKAIKGSAPFVSFPDELTKEKMVIRINFNPYSAIAPSYHFE